MELIHERPDIAYQLLISSIETMATSSMSEFVPTDEDKRRSKQRLCDEASSLGMDPAVVQRLVNAACSRDGWVKKKFTNFLLQHSGDDVWTADDDLFHKVPKRCLPKKCDFERALSDIYGARSKRTHTGKSFPATAAYTGGPTVSHEIGWTLFGAENPFPPVVWFERIVNNALFNYWRKSVSNLKPSNTETENTTAIE